MSFISHDVRVHRGACSKISYVCLLTRRVPTRHLYISLVQRGNNKRTRCSDVRVIRKLYATKKSKSFLLLYTLLKITKTYYINCSSNINTISIQNTYSFVPKKDTNSFLNQFNQVILVSSYESLDSERLRNVKAVLRHYFNTVRHSSGCP